MSKRIQLRRGTATDHNTFTGAVGEVTVDTTNNTLRVHDGTTVGGTALVKPSQLPSPASTTTQGLIKIATQSEVNVGTDNTRAIVPNTLLGGMKTHLSATGSAPIYACRAWVNFNAVPLTGTCSRSGTTVTVIMLYHGLTVGQKVYLTVTAGTTFQEDVVITSVPDDSTFTYTTSNIFSGIGDVVCNLFIKASGNVLGISDNGVGDYTVSFSEPMPDANYAVTFGASDGASGSATPKVLTSGDTTTVPYSKTQYGVRVGHNSTADTNDFSVAIFR